jgi:hypothetical protein
MKEYRLDFIRKSHHNGGHEHITHAGNSVGNWELPTADIVSRVENGEKFYVEDSRTGKKAYVGVMHLNGHKYIRTHADSYWNDNLLSLPVRGTSEKSY